MRARGQRRTAVPIARVFDGNGWTAEQCDELSLIDSPLGAGPIVATSDAPDRRIFVRCRWDSAAQNLRP
jgi:hypothetical protein